MLLCAGWLAPIQMEAVTPAALANTAGADKATYKKGDLVWYRQRDGTLVPAKVTSEYILASSTLGSSSLFHISYLLFNTVWHVHRLGPATSVMTGVILPVKWFHLEFSHS